MHAAHGDGMWKESLKKGLPGTTSAVQVNYGLQQRAYGEELPIQVIQRKEEVQMAQKKVILGCTKPPWNPQTGDDTYIFPRPAMKRTCAVGQSIPPIINYRAETLPLCPPCVPLKSTKFQFDKTQLDPSLLEQQGTTTHRTFPPNNPKLKDAIAFNLSTELSSKTRQIDAAKQIEDAKRNSKTRSAQLASKRVSLIAREQKHEAAIREKKKAAAADAAADAVTAMLPQMTNIDELQAEDLQAAIIETTSFDSSDLMVMRRPNQSTKEAVTYVWEHKGAWEQREGEKMKAWSCCMNSRFDSRGCTSKAIRLEAWQYSSYT